MGRWISAGCFAMTVPFLAACTLSVPVLPDGDAQRLIADAELEPVKFSVTHVVYPTDYMAPVWNIDAFDASRDIAGLCSRMHTRLNVSTWRDGKVHFERRVDWWSVQLHPCIAGDDANYFDLGETMSPADFASIFPRVIQFARSGGTSEPAASVYFENDRVRAKLAAVDIDRFSGAHGDAGRFAQFFFKMPDGGYAYYISVTYSDTTISKIAAERTPYYVE